MPHCELCKKSASFGEVMGNPRFCKTHKATNMVNVKSKRCEYHGCVKTNPVFDIEGGKGRFCKEHKESHMVNVKSKRCEHSACDKLASFNFKGGKYRFCATHKENGMVNVSIHSICISDGCNKIPTFDIVGGKGQYCNSHKQAGMIDVKNKRCAHEGCTKSPTFDVEGGKGKYCKLHKELGMVDVKNKRCAFLGCEKLNPTYNIEGGKGRFCIAHKEPGMVDVKNKRCEHSSCNKRPQFDKEGGKGRFCATHKEIGMIDVVNKRCEYDGCTKLNPAYNIEGSRGRFCSIHKKEEMIDVIHKFCKHKDCSTRVYYGKPGLPPTHCAQHREPGMLRLPNSRCSHLGCKEKARYGPEIQPIHCEAHSNPVIERNLVEHPCTNCGLTMVLNAVGMCEFCCPETFKRVALAKQRAAIAAITAAGLTPSSIDATIDGGVCGRERPDVVFQLPDRIIIVEIDEHQHRDRICECEQTRMVNIGQSFGGLPVSFIRWNPDTYTPANIDKESEPVEKRQRLLTDFLKELLDGRKKIPPALVSVIYLYFDGWDGIHKEEWTTIIPFEVSTTLLEPIETISHQ